MINSHIFNERLKRLEPMSTLCKYCDKQHSTNMEDNYFAPIFKEQDRTTLIVYNSVKFNKIEIGIPRCKDCMEIHDNSTYKAWLCTFIVLGVAGLFMYLTWTLNYIYVIVFIFRQVYPTS